MNDFFKLNDELRADCEDQVTLEYSLHADEEGMTELSSDVQ